jgi:hypothetical protein
MHEKLQIARIVSLLARNPLSAISLLLPLEAFDLLKFQ